MTEDNLVQKMFKGTSFMFARMLVSIVASLLAFVFLSRLLTPTEWGVYILAGFIVSLFGISIFIFSPGFEIFTARQIARHLTVKDNAKIRSYMIFAIKYKILVCTIAFVIAFFLADIVSLLYGDPLIGNLVRILSITLITGGLYAFFSFIFQGFHRFEYVFSLVSLQEISYIILLYILFLISGDLNSLVIGQVLAQGIVILAGFMLFLTFLPTKTSSERISWQSQIKRLFKFGTPLIGVDIISSIRVSLRRIFVSIIENYETVAYYNISTNIFLTIRNISGFVTRPLLPTLSALDTHQDFNRIEMTMSYLMRYLTISTCIVGGILIFSMDFIFRLFLTEDYFWLVQYVQIMIVLGIFVGLGGIFTYWLYASGNTRIIPILSLLNVLYSLPLFFIVFWYFGLFGGLLWTVISADLFFIIIWIYVRKYCKINISYKTFTYPFLLFIIAVTISYFIPITILQIITFGIIFSALVILTKGLTKKDLEILKQLDTGSNRLNAFFGRIIEKLGKILFE